MATVYRMENSNGHGPFSPEAAYAHGLSFEAARARVKDMWKNVPWITVDDNGLHAQSPDYPNHFADVLGLTPEATNLAEMLHFPLLEGNWAVGCDSVKQFEHWFPPQSLADFERHGMKLDIYDVPADAVQYGKWQVMFERDKAKLVKSEPLTALLHQSAGTVN